LGDVLLATPLLRSLSVAWPETSFEWAVDGHSRAALEGNPDVDRTVDASGCIRGALDPGALVRLARELRSRRYDAVFVPDRSPLSALLARATAAPLRIGLDSGGRGRLHTVRVPAGETKHEAEIYLDLARAIGVSPFDARPVYEVSDSNRDVARRELGARTGTLRVAIHPGGGVNPGMRLTEKRWPARRFGQLAAYVVDRWGAEVVVLGGPDDRDLAASVEESARTELRNVAGRLSLGQTAAAIADCDVYVGNDTGVSHLATAVKTPVVMIFGPTDPRRYGPVPGTGRAVSPSIAAVDRLADARGSRAIEEVSVEQVLDAMEDVAEERGLRS
jgi:lipopolysaccharide heptosyltransferase II